MPKATRPILASLLMRAVASSTLSFFSEKTMSSLSDILGHKKLNAVVNELDSSISEQIKSLGKLPLFSTKHDMRHSTIMGDEVMRSASIYIEGMRIYSQYCGVNSILLTICSAYFDQVHPIYPFLDRDSFEKVAMSSRVQELLETNKTWSALYYGVLSLGSLYHDGGSFTAKTGTAWKFFHASLELLPEILMVRRTLMTAQVSHILDITPTYSSLTIM